MLPYSMWRFVGKKNPKKENLEDQNSNAEDQMNIIVCSLFHYQHFLIFLLKSVHNLSGYLAKRKTHINASKNMYLPGADTNTHHQDVLTLADCAETTKKSWSMWNW